MGTATGAGGITAVGAGGREAEEACADELGMSAETNQEQPCVNREFDAFADTRMQKMLVIPMLIKLHT